MNKTIEVMKNHRSIRNYKNQEIDQEIIDSLIEVAQHAPNSINAQQSSIIVIKDKETKRKISKYSGGQTWIEQCPVFFVFVMDFFKTNIACEIENKQQKNIESVESIMVGCVDIGLGMQNVITAAESLGLGTVCIGGIRNNPEGMIKLLDLPQYTFPVVGLCLGYPEGISTLKPRLPKESFYHNETYKKENLKNIIEKYDSEMSKYLEKINRSELEKNWSSTVSTYYQKVYFPKIHDSLKKQGFKNDK